jgi:hypothetical protein
MRTSKMHASRAVQLDLARLVRSVDSVSSQGDTHFEVSQLVHWGGSSVQKAPFIQYGNSPFTPAR